MKILTKTDITNILLSLNIEKGMNLFIQSDLGKLGRIENGILGLLESIFSVVGDKSTLVFPSYTFDIHDFNVLTTMPSTDIGSFSRYLFTNKIGTRTVHPIHSHIVIGEKEQEYTSKLNSYSFGKKSIFNQMDNDDFYWLAIGASLERMSTYFHHIEALVQVPYREWITLDRNVVDHNNVNKIFKVEYYSRIFESQNVYNFKNIYDTLKSKRIIIKNNNFEIANFKELKSETILQLKNNSNLFKC